MNSFPTDGKNFRMFSAAHAKINAVMPLLRKIFFYIFVAIYCMVCPVLILRMLGFVFQPGIGLVKTGLIYVSTNPPGARVNIDGTLAHEPTPTVIRDLTPGRHTVETHLKDYISWRNDVAVAGDKATVLDNMLLVPEVWKTKNLTETAFDQLLPLPGAASLIISRGNNIDDITLARINKDNDEENHTEAGLTANELQALFPAQSIYNGARVEGYFTVEKSPFFVLRIMEAEKNKYLWIDPRDKQTHAEDITELLIEEPKYLAWEPADDKNIFSLQGTSVNRLNIKTKAIYPGIMEGVESLAVMDNAVFGLTTEGSLQRCDYDGQNKREPILEIKDLLALAAQNPAFLPLAMSRVGISGNIRGISVDRERSHALVWTKTRVGILDYAYKDQLINVSWIFTDGRNITQTFWANNGNNVLVHDGDSVQLMDKENLGHSRLVRVVKVDANSVVYFQEKSGKMYYLASGSRRLCWIHIVHHKPIIPAPIADSLPVKTLEY